MHRIGILGAGTWGTALARLLCLNGNEVHVWSAIEWEISEFSSARKHPNLPDMDIPVAVRFTKDIKSACSCKEIVIFAVPSTYTRPTAKAAAPFISDNQILVDVAKGIDRIRN
jgi:glycerol-3-phosphate dehydrogenase (NAD(P)+)